MPQEYYHKKVYSRFDHSLGVFLFLRKLGAGLDEQIAGLLHDISHTAFSHVIDWVIGDPTKEDYQDNKFLETLENSEIPPILERYKISIEKIGCLESFPLLEQEAPSLCADRIDYTLREFVYLEPKKVVSIIADLLITYGRLVFRTKESAEEFGKAYIFLQREHWGGDEARTRYYILSKILQVALDKKFLSIDDFSKTDNELLEILIKTGNEEISEGLKNLKNGFKIRLSDERGIQLKSKFRYVDPEVLVGEKIITLSSISPEYKCLLDREIENSSNIRYISLQ